MGTDGRATTAGPLGTSRGDVPEPRRFNDDTPRLRLTSSPGRLPSFSSFLVRGECPMPVSLPASVSPGVPTLIRPFCSFVAASWGVCPLAGR